MSTSAQAAPPARNPVLWFLLVGIILRLLAVNQPLVDAHLFRQAQTALITRGLIEQPGWHFGTTATWRGDLPAHLVLELPVYNYLVIPLCKLTGNLDVSGKLVSVALWVAGFILLQQIWRRCLNARQAFWANLLFVLAPLSVFFGQAFMPEMLVQLLAFGFLVALLRYQEQPKTGRFLLAAGIGLVGMLVKGPEIAHLYLIAAVLVFQKEGPRALRKPAYWAAAILTLLVLKSWSHVMDVANTEYFPEWTSSKVLIGFIGTLRSHFDVIGYAKIATYLICFVLTPVGAVFVCAGIGRLWRTRPPGFSAWWVLSVIFFFVFWSGSAAKGQSYYNLPALGPCALLFGLGVDAFLERCRIIPSRWAAIMVVLAMSPFLAGGIWYLFRPDRVVVESAEWIREYTDPEDLILLKANHREDAVFYEALAPFPYYAQRRFWVYSNSFRHEEMQRALATSKYALVTLPPQETSWVDAWRRRLKRESLKVEKIDSVLDAAGFRTIVHSNEHFVVYLKSPVAATNDVKAVP
jgi:4-amino-4-deoxy-L-arabinose transferase-like glycosyltransferase